MYTFYKTESHIEFQVVMQREHWRLSTVQATELYINM